MSHNTYIIFGLKTAVTPSLIVNVFLLTWSWSKKINESFFFQSFYLNFLFFAVLASFKISVSWTERWTYVGNKKTPWL